MHIAVPESRRPATSREDSGGDSGRDRCGLPSWRAGRKRPTTDATVIAPIAVPSRIGRKASARAPRKNTGIAPSPVANAVAVAAV